LSAPPVTPAVVDPSGRYRVGAGLRGPDAGAGSSASTGPMTTAVLCLLIVGGFLAGLGIARRR
jgi:hypothetical protein